MIIKPEELKIVYEKEDDGRIRPVYFIDAEPVRHGRWVIDREGNWSCDQCGNAPYHCNMENMNFCPNCGVKMDGGKSDERPD